MLQKKDKHFIIFLAVAALGLALGFLGNAIKPTLAIGGLGAVALTLALVFGPIEYSFFVLILYVGFEGMIKIIARYNVVVQVGFDLFMILLAARYILSLVGRGENILRHLPPLRTLLILHTLWWGILFFNPFTLSPLAMLASGKVYIMPVFIFWISYQLCKKEKSVKLFLNAWYAIGIINIVLGIQQFFMGVKSVLAISSYYSKPLEKFGTLFRPFGTSQVAGGFASFVTMGLPIALYSLTLSKRIPTRFLGFLYIGGSIFALIVSKVRSSIIILVGTSALFFLISFLLGDKKAVKRVSFSFVPAIAVIALLVPYFIKTISETNRDGAHAIERMAILGDTDESLKQRSGKLPVMWDFASRYPFGVGGARVGGASTLFTKQIENDPYTDQKVWFADSLFINLLIELGVPGTLIYIALMGAIWLQAFKNVVRPGIEDLRYVSVAILSYLTVMYVLSWGGNSFTAGAALPWFWMTGGMVFGIKEIQESYLSKSSLLSQDRMNQSEAQPQATPHKINAA